MKGLAFLLVLVNVGFFAWHYWVSDPLLDKAAPLPVDATGSLDRLGEVDLEEFARRTPVSLGAPGARVAGASCFAVGPLTGEYSEGAALGRVREWLKSRGGRVGLRTGKYHEIRYHWVYLPPAGTRDAARDRVRELTANAFGNAVVIPEGNMKNAVSIGVYGLRSVRDRDLTRLEAKGFEPQVQEVLRTGRSIWLTARFPAGYEFPAKRFAVAFGGLEAVDTRCPPPRQPSVGAPGTVPPPLSSSTRYADPRPSVAPEARGLRYTSATPGRIVPLPA